ncbi:hemerythrin domain-containing protein [Streptomyces puniciscabiei]
MNTMINPYRTVHKAQRARLFALCADIGRCEASAEALKPLVKRTQYAVTDLREHINHEDGLIHPLLRAHAPEIVEELESQHDHLELIFEQLTAVGARITAMQDDDAGEWGHKFYLTLSHAISNYLAHMYNEETIAWPTLARVARNREVGSRFPGIVSETADHHLHAAADQLPHVTPTERTVIAAEALAATPHERRPHVFAFLTAQLDGDLAARLRTELGLDHHGAGHWEEHPRC